MCLRKGFDIVAELFTCAAANKQDFHLSVIGGMGSKSYAAKLERLEQELGEKIKVEGWVPSESEEYHELLKQNDYLIFPSLEEGQAGSVLDALACGMIPIVTRETGVDISPFGFLEAELGSCENAAILNRALRADAAEMTELKELTLDYYATHHLPWEEELQRVLTHYITTGEVYARGEECPPAYTPRLKEEPVSALRRYLWGPLACGLRWLCPSKQKRKRMYNYYRASR